MSVNDIPGTELTRDPGIDLTGIAADMLAGGTPANSSSSANSGNVVSGDVVYSLGDTITNEPHTIPLITGASLLLLAGVIYVFKRRLL